MYYALQGEEMSKLIYMTECTRILGEIVTHVPMMCIGWITLLLWSAPLRLILHMRTSLCIDTKATHARTLLNSRILSDVRRFWQFERISA
jgi:cytochrome c-type biogenesis protein CcmH/NrfF